MRNMTCALRSVNHLPKRLKKLRLGWVPTHFVETWRCPSSNANWDDKQQQGIWLTGLPSGNLLSRGSYTGSFLGSDSDELAGGGFDGSGMKPLDMALAVLGYSPNVSFDDPITNSGQSAIGLFLFIAGVPRDGRNGGPEMGSPRHLQNAL